MTFEWENLLIGKRFSRIWDDLLTEDQVRKLNDIHGEENINVPAHIKVRKMVGWIDHIGPRESGEDHFMQAVYFVNTKAHWASIAVKDYTTGKKYLISGVGDEIGGNLRDLVHKAINDNNYKMFKLWPNEWTKGQDFWEE